MSHASRTSSFAQIGQRALALILGAFVLFNSTAGTFSVPQASAALPSGYTESYTIKTSVSGLSYVSIEHKSGGDVLWVSHYPTDGDGNCSNDGTQAYIDGSSVSLTYDASMSSTSACYGQGSLGKSVYIESGKTLGITVVSGSVSISGYGGQWGSSYSSWGPSNASSPDGNMEVKVASTCVADNTCSSSSTTTDTGTTTTTTTDDSSTTDTDDHDDYDDNNYDDNDYDDDSDDYSDTGTGASTCTTTTESDGLQCNECTDENGDRTSYSCWYSNTSSSATTSVCEYYIDEDGLLCSECTDDEGNLQGLSCWEDNYSSSYGDDSWKDKYTEGTTCTYDQTDNGYWCEECVTDSGEVVTNTCDDGEDEDNEDDREEEDDDKYILYGDDDDQYYWLEDALDEFIRLKERVEFLMEQTDHVVDYLKQDKEWMGEDGFDAPFLDELIEKQEANKASASGLLTVIDDYSEEWADDLDAYEEDNSSVDVSTLSQKYFLVSNMYGGLLHGYEMKGAFLEWNKEEQKALVRIEASGGTIDDEMQSDLDYFEGVVEDYYAALQDYIAIVADAAVVIDGVDVSNASQSTSLDITSDQVEAGIDAMNELTSQERELWDVISKLYEAQSTFQGQDWIKEEVSMLRDEIGVVEAAFNVLKEKVNDTSVLPPIEEVLDVIEKAYDMLDAIEAAADETEDSEEMESLWMSLEQLGEYVQPRMEEVMEYLDKHLDELDLSAEEKDLIEIMLDMEESMEECPRCDRLDDAYDPYTAEIIKRYLDDEMVDDLINEITASVMATLSEYLDADMADKVMAAVIAHMEQFKKDRYGEDFANTLLSNQNTAFEGMAAVDFSAMDLPALREEVNDLETLYADFENMPLPDAELAEDVGDFWKEVAEVAGAEPTEEDMKGLVEEGQGLYEECEAQKYEYFLSMKDVPGPFDEGYEDTWYAPYVFSGLGDKWEGYKEDGNLTYIYGPTNTTLRAEALKMVLSAFGYEVTESSEDWIAPWQSKGSSLGLTLASEDLTQSVTRGEVFRLIYEVADMDEPAACEGVFPDVGSSDDCKPAVALYEAGIVTGDGETGNARLYENLNRAEMAALIERAVTWQGEQDFVNEELLSYQNQGFWASLLDYLSDTVSWLASTSLLRVLR